VITIVKQRKYIQDFIDFTGSFLLTEPVTINELNPDCVHPAFRQVYSHANHRGVNG